MEVTGQEYRQMNKKVAPKSPVFTNCLKAFLIGGGICTLAEVIVQLLQTYAGMEQKEARLVGSIALIFLSILLTGLNVYDNIAKHAGAGTLVPITGFANAVAAPAIEFKTEGLVLGLAAKMFTIAGPVLVYGITTSMRVWADPVYFVVVLGGRPVMPERKGQFTVTLSSRPTILGYASVVGKKEGEGPLGRYFDYIFEDTTLGEKTWEKAESALQREAFTRALDKAGMSPSPGQLSVRGRSAESERRPPPSGCGNTMSRCSASSGPAPPWRRRSACRPSLWTAGRRMSAAP